MCPLLKCLPLISIPVPVWHSEQRCVRQNYFCIPSTKLTPGVDLTVIYCRGRVNTTGYCHNWHTNIPNMMSHVPLQQYGFDGRTYLTPRSLCGRGRSKLPSKGFSRINKIKEENIITTITRLASAMIAKTACIAVSGPSWYTN